MTTFKTLPFWSTDVSQLLYRCHFSSAGLQKRHDFKFIAFLKKALNLKSSLFWRPTLQNAQEYSGSETPALQKVTVLKVDDFHRKTHVFRFARFGHDAIAIRPLFPPVSRHPHTPSHPPGGSRTARGCSHLAWRSPASSGQRQVLRAADGPPGWGRGSTGNHSWPQNPIAGRLLALKDWLANSS